MDRLTIVTTYYRQPLMLAKQLESWRSYYDERFRFVVIDDGSPEPAIDIVTTSDGVEVYRIEQDIPWNRGGARNLGAHVASSEWMIMIDLDHVLPPSSASRLLEVDRNTAHWYRFPRWRVGKADETRRKDAIPSDCEFGRVKPHIDSFLITKERYWQAGGYNEEFSGSIGGSRPFLEWLTKSSAPIVLPDDIALHVYTRHAIADASVLTLTRDRSVFDRKVKSLTWKGRNPLRFKWRREL